MRLSIFHTFLITALLTTIGSALAYRPAKAGADVLRDSNGNTQSEWGDASTSQLIVKYKPAAYLRENLSPAGEVRVQMLSSAAGIDLEYLRVTSDNAHILRLPNRMSVAEVEILAADIAALPDVEYAEPDYIMFPAFIPNDPQYGSQWHYFETYGINLPEAWNFTVGSSNVRIAVLDTGITDHVDLTGRWVGGYDFITDILTANDGNGRDNDPHDPGNWITSAENTSGPFAGCGVTNSTWHGTHVAGTIGATGNNSIGVAGVNWASPIVPIRVLGKCGGFTSDIADGMRWAAGLSVSGLPANPNPARVLNLSLAGIGACSATYQNAINNVNAVGAIVVVAAGNNSANLNVTTIQPANCNGVITVASTDRGGDKSFSSNYGSTIEISAPGGETSPTLQNGVFSTLNTGIKAPGSDTYGFYAGTSMAAPHVSGVISLMLSLDPTLDGAEILQILQNTARSFPAGSSCTPSTCGGGIVDAGSAVEALGVPPATSTPTSTPIPPTSTLTSTSTPVPPTATLTRTNTSIPPTATFTRTNTPVPSTATSTLTTTSVPPTATFTRTNTSVPPTATSTLTTTSIPPTATFTRTNTSVPSTAKSTQTTTSVPLTATFTRTNTPVPPTEIFTSTSTPIPPIATFTRTNTPALPTATFTRTNTPIPATPTFTRTNTPGATQTSTPTATPSSVPDTFTKALLHMDGMDGSTSFVDQTGRAWSANGNAQLDTAQSKFGGASALFDGSGDYLQTSDHADFEFGSGDFTIDFWIRPNSVSAGDKDIYNKGLSGSNELTVRLDGDKIRVLLYQGKVLKFNIVDGTGMSAGTWYHIALVRNGSTFTLYKNGVSVGSAVYSGSIADNSSVVRIGCGDMGGGAGRCFNGWLDEFRVSKGIARWTSTFTPPTNPY